MLHITCMPLINSLPADIICDSFDLVVVQWNRETQTLRHAKSVLSASMHSSLSDFFLLTMARPRRAAKCAAKPAPRPRLTPAHRRYWGIPHLRRWHSNAVLAYPQPPQRARWAATCALAPLDGICPRVVRLQDLLLRAWNGWRRAWQRSQDAPVWISAVPTAAGHDLGTKGAMVHEVVH